MKKIILIIIAACILCGCSFTKNQYASYQHAKQVISAADSRKYTITSDGYGSVFKFTGKGVSVYDNSEGVSISV